MADIIKRHGLYSQRYADDTQLYIHVKPGDVLSEKQTFQCMERCVTDIKNWMYHNELKLNDGKTECVLIGNKHDICKIRKTNIKVGDTVINAVDCVKNLGVFFDKHMNMETLISAKCKSSFFMLWSIAQVKKYLTPYATESLIHAFITSKLDYCNGLMYGIPKNQLVRLQRVQNAAARLVKSVPKFEHVTPVLIELHWLPVQSRIEFKIVLTVYKILNDEATQYLKDSVCLYEPSICNLRSSHEYLLCVPKSILVSAGDCNFSVVGPKIWNSLPYSIKQSASLNDFKTNVKTFLFLKAYN